MAIAHAKIRLAILVTTSDRKDDYEDTPYLLAKAVNLLSVLESVSFQEIVNAIDASVHVG